MADEKYRTQLTGAQVDDALQQLNQRVAEGWAVGTRDGSPVGPGSEYYDNNAKYWAEQSHSSADEAEAAAERAEAAVPAGTAGAVFFDRAQSLTDTQKEQARKNIAAANTNPNLLDNPWFNSGNVINQRGAATLPVGGYGIDRWKGGSAGAVTVVSDGLQFVGRGNAYQIPPSGFWDSMMGKTVTASLLFSDGTLQGGSGVIGSGVTEFGTYNGVRIYKSSSNNFNLESNSDANCIVRAVKLEVGSVSTLANDTPPDYGEELIRCIYSTADSSDTYANNGFGRTNPNLLDNWWFGNPVNQRGQTTYNGSGTFLKTIDRWLLANGSGENNLDVRSGYVAVKSDSNGFIQRIEPSLGTALNGKVLTWSVLLNDGTLKTVTGKYDNTTTVSLGNGFYCGLISGSQTIVSYTTGYGTTQWIKAMKVELGTVSTLANDVPPKEDQVTADCKWYFQRIQQEDGYTAPVGFGIVAASTTILRTLIPLSSPLRKAGSLTATATNIGQMRVQGNGANLTPTAITGRGVLNGHAIVDITVNGTLANNQFYTLVFANSTAIIDLSKDL